MASRLARATFVPPPVADMHRALDNFEKFLYDDLAPLVHCALAHAQFETIHPFLDGNGRIGRLLITFLLIHRNVLHRPLLYLSHYLKGHRAEYYDRLMAIREDGDWEGWLRFFLRGVAETADEATRTVHAILELREQHRTLIQEHGLGMNALRLLDALFQTPLVNATHVAEALHVSFPTAGKLLEQMETLRIVREITGARRNRRYIYTSYLALFEASDEPAEEAPIQTTEGDV